VVGNPNNPGMTVMLRKTEDAVHKLNIQVEVVDAQTSDEFERVFAQLSAKSVDGVVLLADPTVIEHSRRIAELAQSARLPTAFQRRENVDAGGLFSYGPDINNQFRQAAFYVDRILKGEKPAELPVQEPTKVELVINLKTAKALGLTVPRIMQMTADEVIKMIGQSVTNAEPKRLGLAGQRRPTNGYCISSSTAVPAAGASPAEKRQKELRANGP
jgi:putative ABC transport system substrate-binding protein